MIKNGLLLILILLISYSCTVYREYAIEVFSPEQVMIAPDSKNIAVLNRNFKFLNDTLTTFYKINYDLRKDRTLTEKETDSILISNCLQGFVSTINENRVFEKVNVLPPDLIKKHYGEKMGPLTPGVIDKLTGSTKSDLLISLETYSAFFSGYTASSSSGASNEVITVAVWAVYDPVHKREIERKSMIDTIFWNGMDDSGKPEKLPSRQTALEVASRVAGQSYAKRFTSSWEKVYRMYSIPPVEDFRIAAALFEEGKWDEAMDYWVKYTPKKNGRLSISANYNMALACEMKDEHGEAIKWISLALQQAMVYKSKPDIDAALLYKNILQKRAREMQFIKQKAEMN